LCGCGCERQFSGLLLSEEEARKQQEEKEVIFLVCFFAFTFGLGLSLLSLFTPPHTVPLTTATTHRPKLQPRLKRWRSDAPPKPVALRPPHPPLPPAHNRRAMHMRMKKMMR
jgi:hypothetical protein